MPGCGVWRRIQGLRFVGWSGMHATSKPRDRASKRAISGTASGARFLAGGSWCEGGREGGRERVGRKGNRKGQRDVIFLLNLKSLSLNPQSGQRQSFFSLYFSSDFKNKTATSFCINSCFCEKSVLRGIRSHRTGEAIVYAAESNFKRFVWTHHHQGLKGPRTRAILPLL